MRVHATPVTNQTLTINNLNLTNGNSTTSQNGALEIWDGFELFINNSTFYELTSNSDNGAALNIKGVTRSVTVRNSTFRGNESSYGGAIDSTAGVAVTIEDSTFTNNKAIIGDGGAIRASSGATITISDSTFSGNSASSRGGAIQVIDGNSSLNISNSVFTNNSTTGTGNGGAIRQNAPMTLYRSFFSGNSAGGAGGAIYIQRNLVLENSTFYNNRSVDEGGALDTASSFSPAINIRHVTFVNNRATGTNKNGNAIFAVAAAAFNMYNSIIDETTSAAGTDCGGTLDVNTNNIIEDGSCSTSSGFSVDPLLASRRGSAEQAPGQYYPLRHDSPAIDAADATACGKLNDTGTDANPVVNPDDDQRGVSRPVGAFCDIGAYEGFIAPPPPDSGGGSGGDDEDAEAMDEPGTPCADCDELTAQGYRLKATNGFSSGVQFRRVGPVAIGDQSLLAPGFLDAVDVYGWAEQGVGVCFPMAGSPLLLDAAFSPRRVVSVAAYSQDGMTCADFDRPGTVVLLAGEPPPSASGSALGAQSVSAQTLDNCMVTTLFILNFRQTPGGERLHFVDPWGAEIAGWLPQGVRLTALERTAEWFKVDYHGNQGWISASFVRTHGACG